MPTVLRCMHSPNVPTFGECIHRKTVDTRHVDTRAFLLGVCPTKTHVYRQLLAKMSEQKQRFDSSSTLIVLLSVLLTDTYHVFIITVKTTFVLATLSTEAGTCASSNLTDHDRPVFSILSGTSGYTIVNEAYTFY